MSTNTEVDLFADIEILQKDSWKQFLNKEIQESQSTLIKNSPLKKEADSDISDEDDDTKIVKELPGILPDLLIRGETDKIEVHSRPNSQNPITNLPPDVEKPLNAKLSNRVFHFRKGHNLHSLFAT